MDESLFPMKKLREPKVIVFEEPGRSKTSNKNENRKTRKPIKIEKPQEDDSDSDSQDFISVAREVKEFGITGFTRKDQKKNRQKYAEHLGAHKQKQQKVPYPMLMERIKRRKAKEERETELQRAMGVYKKKKKVESESLTTKMNLGRWVDKSAVGKASVDSHLKVSKRDLAKMKSKRK